MIGKLINYINSLKILPCDGGYNTAVEKGIFVVDHLQKGTTQYGTGQLIEIILVNTENTDGYLKTHDMANDLFSALSKLDYIYNLSKEYKGSYQDKYTYSYILKVGGM